MDKYFILDPDEGSWFLYISDLTETQQNHIKQIYDALEDNEDVDDDDENVSKCKFFLDVPGDYYGEMFSNLKKYLKEQGFKQLK